MTEGGGRGLLGVMGWTTKGIGLGLAMGLVALGFMWARMAALAARRAEEDFYRAKLATARFFMARVLPQTADGSHGMSNLLTQPRAGNISSDTRAG